MKVYHLVNVKTGAIKLTGWGEYYITDKIMDAAKMVNAFADICEYKIAEGNPYIMEKQTD
jgi:hypothetical protein